MSIQWRLVLIFLAMLVPISALLVVNQERFYQIMEEQTSLYTAQYIEKISYDIELALSELDLMAAPLTRDMEVRAALSGGDPEAAQKRLEQMLLRSPGAQEMGSAILLLNRSQRIVASTYDEWTGLLRVLGAQWLDKIIEAGGEKVVISGYSITKGQDLISEKVLSIARAVFDQQRLLGYLMVEVPIDVLTQLCAGVTLGNNGFVALVDSDNYVLYNTKTENIGSKFVEIAAPTSERNYHVATLGGVPMFLVEVPGQYSGIRVIGAIPVTELSQSLSQLKRSTTLAVVCIAILMIGLILVMTRQISGPIVSMGRAMKRVEQGDFSVRLKRTRRDEIGDLQQGFNGMVEQVDALIAREYKTALRQREAQLNEMMSIINPHFIYNTLEAISMSAYLNDDEKTVDMISRLADIFRAMAEDAGLGFLTLRQELDTVENYLTLLNVRADGQIHVHWTIDERLADAKVMRFTLQPIVENSVLHGFRDQQGGNIWICLAEQGEGDVLITVEDDGCGVDDAQLEVLRSTLSEEAGAVQARPMALKNVHDRLRLAFGEAYGITVSHREDGGLRVMVRLPLWSSEEAEA